MMIDGGLTPAGIEVRYKRRLGLEISILAMFITGVIFLVVPASETASAGTTIMDGDWYINEDTILSDGRWLVNGTIFISNCTLSLDHAQVVFTSTSTGRNRIYVEETGRLKAIDSRIDGGAMGVCLEVMGDTMMENTMLTNMDRDYRGCGIYHVSGDLQVYNSTFEYGTIHIWSRSNLTVRSCSFSDFKDRAIDWAFRQGTTKKIVRIEGSVFQNKRIEGTAIQVQGSNYDPYVKAYISNNTFRDVRNCIFCGGFMSWGSGDVRSLLIEGNSAFGCYSGLRLSGSSSIMVRGNTWDMRYPSLVHSIGVMGDGSPSLSDEMISGGMIGMRIAGGYIEIRNFTIEDVDIGIIAGTNIDIYNSRIDSKVDDFQVFAASKIHLHDCQHNYRCWVFGTGEILELVEINITSVTWQEGTPIRDGVVVLETETGFQLAERNNTRPSPVMLPVWIRREMLDLHVGNVRGAYRQGDLSFYSEPFSVKGVENMSLVIHDRFTPIVKVDYPVDGAKSREDMLLMRGTCLEKGAGMGAIIVRCSGRGWEEAALLPNGRWYLTLAGLPDGTVNVWVNATDRANNSMQVVVRDIIIDATLPTIDVVSPPAHVRAMPVELVVRTEPGSVAQIDGVPVEVTENGMFSALITLLEGENRILITVEDRVGNRNATTHVVFLDTVAPLLRLSSPGEGGWARDETVWVNGTTEPDARVTVNGEPADVALGAFSVPLALGEGETTVVVTATDLAGNVATLTRTVRVDRTPPELEIIEPADGHVTSGRVLISVGSATDASPVMVLVQGCPASMVSARWLKELLLTEGANTIEVVAVDAAGNTATRQVEVRLDTRPPSLEVTVTVGGRSFGAGGTVIITNGTEARFEVLADEEGDLELVGRTIVPITAGRLTMTYPLEEGINRFAFVMRDAAGNEAGPILLLMERDTLPSKLVVTFPIDGTVTEEPYISVVGMTENGTLLSVKGIRVRASSDGSFATSVPLGIGLNRISIEVTDAANNTSSVTIDVVREEPKDIGPATGGNIMYFALFGLVVGCVLAIVIDSSKKRYNRGRMP